MVPKILLVDDREDNLLSISAILDQDGYKIVKANSGKQALKTLLQEFDFAMILMDVQMPNLNGFETAALIYEREKLRHIPIIFITAHNYGEDNIYMGYRSGAVDYIYKPINPELLRAKVAVFVELYRKNHALLIQEQKLIAINASLKTEINERRMSEERVQALNLQLLKNIDSLETANKDLDRFAFMASHDLQEPLRKIRLFTDFLYTNYGHVLDNEGKDYTNRIQRAAERMQMLIKDILTFSKISTEKNVYVKSDLNALVNEVVMQLDDSVKEKNAELIIEKLPDLVVNPVLMQPLFYNLISNALKYSKKDVAPRIKIFSDYKTEDENNKAMDRVYCRVYVEDNGIGFDQKYSEQIFAMFKRLHNNTEYEGTGIGLALCKKIVEEHRGFISAMSKLDQGSTFIVSLPVNLQVTESKEADVSVWSRESA